MGEVKPDLTVVEPIFTPGLTLSPPESQLDGVGTEHDQGFCRSPTARPGYAVEVSPVSTFVEDISPEKIRRIRRANLFLTSICSAMPFPLPWSLVPYNIFLNLVTGYVLLTDTRIKSTTEVLHREIDASIALITANELGVFKAPPPGLRILIANSPDIDCPFGVLPPYVIPCGPIVRPAPPIRSVDLALAEWLSRRPTVYVNLGTRLKASSTEAVEMARAFSDVLSRASRSAGGDQKPLQLLWKLGRKPEANAVQLEKDVYEGSWIAVVDVLGPEVEADMVRITDWVTAEPKSVLESGHVVCSVHHGGASSF